MGWATLSAADEPVLVFGHLQLPPITRPSDHAYALLRPLHRCLAYLLFAVWLVHLGAALFHRLVRRDQVLQGMTWHDPGLPIPRGTVRRRISRRPPAHPW